MELLHICSFLKGSNYFLSSFQSFRINGFISFRLVSRIAYSNSCKLLQKGETSNCLDYKNEDPMIYFNRAFSNNGFFNKLKNYSAVIKERNDRSYLAMYLYRSIENINFNEFYNFLEMADTFNSWFVVMELHIWMLLSQLMDNKKDGIKLRNKIVEIFWFDVDARISSLKLNTPKIIKKQLSELSSRLPVALLVYDEGLLSTDFVLAGAIWYKFFDKQTVDPRKLEILVKYIRHQIQHLTLLNLKDYNEVQKISQIWLPVTPHINAVMSEN